MEIPQTHSAQQDWPQLDFPAWQDSCATLHLWTQIIGKIRLLHMPWTNHSWHVPLYVSVRGLTTSLIACKPMSFEIEFDFIAHRLLIQIASGAQIALPLRSQSVAAFYREVTAALHALGIEAGIRTMPCELPDATPFDQDESHCAYDPEYVNRFWRALLQSTRVLNAFRARYLGKCSPVHFFWGSFDLAVTRFSGRAAPPHPGGVPNLPDWVAREAYSHEVSSCGFWPGNAGFPHASYYAYAYPEPQGYAQAKVPPDAHYDSALREFLLPYEAVRTAPDPDALLLDFLESTYAAAAALGDWDRKTLER
ncbi:DUF5996 family protein [Noviherbaspirillum pedocola]|uniref:Ava_C0101 and related proteins n=1 Tax=Noviherbaspirillum pedocola TaxID=2801341 RepID=A0A934W424_9BURK|nr:DUF5996 family protein [Noviherbaspirillum pedocola]MBK4738056.1 hypothetical protein [Noviherbaspirillum pedocola]